MSDSSKAVFLSYASQDADAARKICEALRGAGVEVWFDQSELRGGDAWDAKIRKQIKECALFVPVISANTQARREGYFRIEWKLAAQRTHAIAEGTPFLLPVLLGEVPEPAALVPTEFRDVQWTRLRVEDSPAGFASRVGSVLTGDQSAATQVPPSPAGAHPQRSSRQPRRWVKVVALAGLVAAALFALRPLWRQAGIDEAALDTRLRGLLRTSNREEVTILEEMTRQRTDREPQSARAWSARAFVESIYLIRGWDTGEKRRQAAQTYAQRALAIDRNDVRAISVLANVFIAQHAYAEAEAMARRALQVRPDDPANSRVLAIAMATQGRVDESVAMLEELTRRFPNQSGPYYSLALLYENKTVPDFEAALRTFDAAANASEYPEPSANILLHKAALLVGARGDFVGARALLDQLSPVDRMEDRAVGTTVMLALLERQPARALAAAGRTARVYFEDLYVPGPKAWRTALAYRIEGKDSLAQEEWRVAERVLRQRLTGLAPAPVETAALAVTLAWLGQREEAAKLMDPIEAQVKESPPRVVGLAPDHLRLLYLGYYYAGLGEAEPAVGYIRQLLNRRELLTDKTLPLDPWWDRLRGKPEFEALQAEAKARAVGNNAVAATAAALDPKSVVVLPFENLSPDPENAYFADGVHEDLLTNLTYVRDLVVVPRITTMRYRQTKKSPREIAGELRIARIVSGSVRRSGATVRVTTQLIDARTEKELWTWRRDYQLTDVFELQNALAIAIAAELKAVLSPQERTIIARRPTESVEAYELLLKIREANDRMMVRRSKFDEIEAMGLKAVTLDPNFAEAWAEVARARSGIYHFGFDQSPAMLARVTEAIEMAYRLAPDSPEVIGLRGEIFYRCHRDYSRALEHYRRQAKLQPNNPLVYQLIGVVQRRQGRWLEAIESMRKAVELDPRWPTGWLNLRHSYGFVRRWKDALDAGARRQALENTFHSSLWHAVEEFRFTGARHKLEALRAPLLAEKNGVGEAHVHVQAAILLGEYAYAIQLHPASLQAAWAEAGRGQLPAARERALAAIGLLQQRLQREAAHAGLWSELAQLHAIRGEADEALRCGRQAVAMSPENRDAIDGPSFAHDLAVVRAWIGDKDGAIAELGRVLRLPGVQTDLNMPLSVHTLRNDPRYLPLKGDARFEALLNDPKNDAPLF